MGKVKAAPQFSESISSFCKLMENAQRDYAWNYDEVNRMDRLTQDYLHKLELDGLDYKERAKVATQLAKCRQARRECKDTVEILESLVQFLESDKGKNLLNLVREALGKTRKVEERILKSKPPRFRLRKTERSHRLTQRKQLLKQKQKQRHCVLLRRQKLTQTARLRLHLPMS